MEVREKLGQKLDAVEEGIIIPVVSTIFFVVDWWGDKPHYVRTKLRNAAIFIATIATIVMAVGM